MQLFGNKRHDKDSPRGRAQTDKEIAENLINEDIASFGEPDETYARKSYTESEESQQPRGKKKKKKKAGKVILIILLVLALIAGGAYIVIEYFLNPPEVDDGGLGNKPSTTVEGRREGVYTFLIAGTDQISNNTDTIMVGSFDTVNHKVNVVSIPRDTLINIQHEVKKANASYHYASYYKDIEGTSYYEKDPVQVMRQELVKSMLGFDVDFYVLVNLDAAEQVVDAIGGVEFDLPINMDFDSRNQDLHIHLQQGKQTLSGEQFVQVMRFRSAYSGGDLDRIEMQHKLLAALADQMLTVGNVPNLTNVAKIVTDNMQTDLSTENIIYFAKEFLKVDKKDVKFMTLPKLEASDIFGFSYVFTDIDAWLKMVNDYINPWTTPVTAENVNIVTFMNGDFYSTTGELNGGVGSFLSYNSGDSKAYADVIKYTGPESTQPTDTPNSTDEDDDTNDATE